MESIHGARQKSIIRMSGVVGKSHESSTFSEHVLDSLKSCVGKALKTRGEIPVQKDRATLA